MLLLGNEDVMQVLDMPTTLEALDGSFAEMAKGDAVGMGRIIEPNLSRAVDVPMRAGEATPRLQQMNEATFYARAGFLAYVAGTAEERASVPHVNLPDDIIGMPRLVDLVAGKAKGRTSAQQTTFFLNVGAIGAQFEAVAAAVHERARAKGLGHAIPDEWFLQDVRD